MKKILVGLGNPGKEYENTYHNVGRLCLDQLLELRGTAQDDTRHSAQDNIAWSKHKDLFEYTEIDGNVFIKPLTFMNESGRAVREALKKFNAKPADLVLFHDDSDITIGSYKISFARNSAGHKGVQSTIDALRTKDFTRARIGIRPVREKVRQKAGEFALKQISPSHHKTFAAVFKEISSSSYT